MVLTRTSQFLAKGYKVGRVDQSETALGAEMRKAAAKTKGSKSKEPDIVGRELKAVFTSGTLVDGLTEDMGNHCIAIKASLPLCSYSNNSERRD